MVEEGIRAVASKTLIEKIDALPPEKRAAVERYVEELSTSRPVPTDDWLARVKARRERLQREHGLFDSVAVLREMRENGE
jgi:hypothetical protein